MGECCEACRFGEFRPASYFRDCPGMVSRRAEVSCRRYPDARTKSPSDWCGEFMPAPPTKGTENE